MLSLARDPELGLEDRLAPIGYGPGYSCSAPRLNAFLFPVTARFHLGHCVEFPVPSCDYYYTLL